MPKPQPESVRTVNVRRDAPGVDVVSRVAAIMRTIASARVDATTTSKIARTANLPRPTVHRLLSSLADEGLIDRDLASGRWALGPELFLLGAAAAPRFDVTDQARDIVRGLAVQTGESAFLSARRGDETVCLLREDGSFPLRSHVLYEGIRLPLGVASAGLAILAHMPQPEREDYLRRTRLDREWGDAHASGPLSRRVAETQRAGFAVNPGMLVEGSWGIGAAVFDATGAPSWALSLTGVETRFSAERIPKLGRTLLDNAHELSKQLAR